MIIDIFVWPWMMSRTNTQIMKQTRLLTSESIKEPVKCSSEKDNIPLAVFQIADSTADCHFFTASTTPPKLVFVVSVKCPSLHSGTF